MSNNDITELFDQKGRLIGCLLSAEAWQSARHLFDGATTSNQTEEPSEPISDWETLQEYWDFQYPVDMDVQCESCGNTTDDWSKDDPRLFRLTAASLSGLVTFLCTQCKAKIIKRHFKDEILTETHPYQDTKNPKTEGKK